MEQVKETNYTVVKVVLALLVEMFYFYFIVDLSMQNNWLISMSDVNSGNVLYKFVNDFAAMLVPVLLIFIVIFSSGGKPKDLGMTTQSGRWTALLAAIYVGLFLWHGDFSVRGFYTAFFYLVMVAFGEELVFRGFAFTILDNEVGFWKAAIISGIFFGAMHGIMPTILAGDGFGGLMMRMMSEVTGQGILGTAMFAYVYKKSGTLFVPVLIHAILDYM